MSQVGDGPANSTGDWPTAPAGYVEARKVLLDALQALDRQRDAIVLAGAQAVYLRSGPNPLALADYTTDGDLVLDPSELLEEPLLGETMIAAGFAPMTKGGSTEPGIWCAPATIEGVEVEIPVDLIVPEGIAAPQGRRGARLGVHGNRAARKIPGVESALVDNDSMIIVALDPSDGRSFEVKVAGIAALLLAKSHKLTDHLVDGRAGRVNRVLNKDASDVVRLMGARPPRQVGEVISRLIQDPVAGEPARDGLRRFQRLFGVDSGEGVRMAVSALRMAMPEEQVHAICRAYAGELAANAEPT